MLSGDGFVEQSLRVNLVFLRVSKEHSFFLESSLTPRSAKLRETAACFRRQFLWLLQEAVGLSNGVLERDALESGQIVTSHTLQAELLTQFYTGAVIDTALTRAEAQLQPRSAPAAPAELTGKVSGLNRQARSAAIGLAGFAEGLLADVLACKVFMNMYPLLIDHILRETTAFVGMLARLQDRADPLEDQNLPEQAAFWNRILGDHAVFIRGLLDPTERELFHRSDRFAQELYQLSDSAEQASGDPAMVRAVAGQSLRAAGEFRDFGAGVIQGMMQCGVRSVLLPLALDHDVREANFYIYQTLHTMNGLNE